MCSRIRGLGLLMIGLGIFAGCLDADLPDGQDADGGPSEPAAIQSGGGELEWVIRAGGPLDDWGESLDVYADGSFVVSGSYGDASDQPESTDRYAVFAPGAENEVTLSTDEPHRVDYLARYTAAGELLWAKSLPDTATTTVVAATSDGGSVIAGAFAGEEIVFGEGEAAETRFVPGEMDGFVARLDADAALEFAVHIKSGDFAIPRDTCAFDDGGILVTGEFRGETIFGEGDGRQTLDDGNAGNINAMSTFIAGYDAGGSLRFAAGLNDVPGLGVSAVCLDDGAFVISGTAHSGNTFGRGEPGETVLFTDGAPGEHGIVMNFVARYNDDGTLSWVRGISALLGGNDVAARPDGRVLWLVENELHRFEPDGEALPPQLLAPDDGGALPPAIVTGIAHSPDNAVAVMGVLRRSCVFGEGEANETRFEFDEEHGVEKDIVLAKYREDGTLLWAERAGGADQPYDEAPPYLHGENPFDLAVLDDASVLVTGSFDGTVTFDGSDPNETELSAAGLADMFVAKYRP